MAFYMAFGAWHVITDEQCDPHATDLHCICREKLNRALENYDKVFLNRPTAIARNVRVKVACAGKRCQERCQIYIFSESAQCISCKVWPFKERMNAILDWKILAAVEIKENKKILEKATKFKKIGIRSKDALHISCAISAKCKYFLTTDDKILNKNNSINDISIIDPIGFIKEVYI